MSGSGQDAAATVERLLADAELLPNPHARALARALAAALVDLVGAGMTRVIDIAGPSVARQLADDELVGSLLVLAGMHPDDVAARAAKALAAATAELASLGVEVDAAHGVVGEGDGDGVRVRLSAVRGAVPDAARVQAMVEAIVIGRAPDCEVVVVELAGVRIAERGFVPVERLRVLP